MKRESMENGLIFTSCDQDHIHHSNPQCFFFCVFCIVFILSSDFTVCWRFYYYGAVRVEIAIASESFLKA